MEIRCSNNYSSDVQQFELSNNDGCQNRRVSSSYLVRPMLSKPKISFSGISCLKLQLNILESSLCNTTRGGEASIITNGRKLQVYKLYTALGTPLRHRN